MKYKIATFVVLCAVLFIAACGRDGQAAPDAETVMTSFIEEFFSVDVSYEDLNAYATDKLIETLQANRMPGMYRKNIWEYSDTISCRDISFTETSEDHYDFTMTLSWEDEEGELTERTVEGTIRVTFDDKEECRVYYFDPKL